MVASLATFGVVTERWSSERHWWACTFAAGVMGRRWETWATPALPPATEAEVRALASVSGDPDLSHGSTARELVVAVRRRYRRSWAARAVTRAEWLRLCARPGTGLVCGFTAGRMPAAVRRFHGSFTGGHRVFVGSLGERDRLRRPLVRVYDPLMPAGSHGVKVRPEELWAALWEGEVVVLAAHRAV